MSKGSSSPKVGDGGKAMSQAAASRIQSATARSSGGQVTSGSFAARAQAAAARGSGGSNPSQGGGGKRAN